MHLLYSAGLDCPSEKQMVKSASGKKRSHIRIRLILNYPAVEEKLHKIQALLIHILLFNVKQKTVIIKFFLKLRVKQVDTNVRMFYHCSKMQPKVRDKN